MAFSLMSRKALPCFTLEVLKTPALVTQVCVDQKVCVRMSILIRLTLINMDMGLVHSCNAILNGSQNTREDD